jgi:hypothetical protein
MKACLNSFNGKVFAGIESTLNPTEYDYIVFLDEDGYYEAVEGLSGNLAFGGKYNTGLSTGNSTNLALVLQATINALEGLTPEGGYILLKNLALPSGITYDNSILIGVNYQGIRSFYRNNALLSVVGDLGPVGPQGPTGPTGVSDLADGNAYIIYYNSVTSKYAAKTDNFAAITESTSLSTVILQAIANLTSERTYKERILLYGGVIYLDAPITVPSYTIIEHIGIITPINDFVSGGPTHANMFYLNGTTDSEVHLDMVDMNVVGQSEYPIIGHGNYQFNVMLINNSTMFDVGIKHGYNGLLNYSDGVNSQEVIGINIANMTSTQYGKVSRLGIKDFQFGGLYLSVAKNIEAHIDYIDGAVDGITLVYGSDCEVFGGYIERCNDAGVVVGEDEGNLSIITFHGTVFDSNAFGTIGNQNTTHCGAVAAYNNAQIYLDGCKIYVPVSGGGFNTPFQFGTAAGNLINAVNTFIVGDNTSDALMTLSAPEGILSLVNCNFSKILGPNFNGSNGLQYYVTGGSISTDIRGTGYPHVAGDARSFKNVIGFVTENSGYAYLANGVTSIVITHGLYAQPTTIIVSDAGGLPSSSPAGLVFSDTNGATYFTIKCENSAGDKYISWVAIYKP